MHQILLFELLFDLVHSLAKLVSTLLNHSSESGTLARVWIKYNLSIFNQPSLTQFYSREKYTWRGEVVCFLYSWRRLLTKYIPSAAECRSEGKHWAEHWQMDFRKSSRSRTWTVDGRMLWNVDEVRSSVAWNWQHTEGDTGWMRYMAFLPSTVGA